MPEQYDVFISHKSEQLTWALRLQGTLELYGFRTFVDHSTYDNLRAEQDWRQQLYEHCTNAKHMIVLWSKLITPSSFVHEEISWRIQACHADPTRRVILLPLNEMREAPLHKELKDHYGNRQAFRDFIELYRNLIPAEADAGAYKIEFFAWHDAARRFIEQIIPDAASRIVEVPFVVAAMTYEQAEELQNGKNLNVRQDVYDRLMAVAGRTKSFDISRYGDTPEDWRPLPTMQQYDWKSPSIRKILTHYEQERRRYIMENEGLLASSPEYRLNRVYVPFTDQIAGSREQRNLAVQRLQKRPCLVFVDPLSLMHRDVYRVYDMVKSRLENAFTIGMSPFIPMLHQDFDDYLAQEADLIEALGLLVPYESFHSFFDDALKASVMNVDHGYELARWVQFATDNITRYLSELRPDPRWGNNSNLRQGPSKPPTL